MMKRYNPSEIEPKWQEYWRQNDFFKAADFGDKPKFYTAEMFPYPSGDGLHVGHVRNFTIVDVIARYKTQQGFNVLRSFGYDTFGLPAENYAIKTGTSPQDVTKQNIANFRNQAQKLGFAIDWSRELNTSDPEYYRWTQWIFGQMYKKGLAYKKESSQWWCPFDKTVLANEQVESGKCWRCGNEVEKKRMSQWFFAITKYADELLEEIDNLDWPEKIKTMQRNWIGKSVGAEIDFAIDQRPHFLSDVNPPRPDKKFTKRRFVMVVVRDPKADKFLAIKWKKFPWVSMVGGGVEDGEDIVEAARREVLEETGYKNLKFVKPLLEYTSEFYAANKDVNRYLDAAALLFELADNEQVAMSGEEKAIQEPIWLKRSEFKKDEMPAYHETMAAFARLDDELIANDLHLDLTVFTTRPDTIFGATFMVLAPEHPDVVKITTDEKKAEVQRYIEKSAKKSEIERQENKDKTGVFTGAYAINPATNQKIPIWVADYVLMGYGTGAIMAVPAHDERDYEFAKKFDIPIKQVIAPSFGEKHQGEAKKATGTAIIGYNPKSSKYLIMQTDKGDAKYRLPCGGIEEGESFEDCARRELFEETGYRADQIFPVTETIVAYFYNSIKKIHVDSTSKIFMAVIDDVGSATDGARETHEQDFRNVWMSYDQIHDAIYDETSVSNSPHWLYALERTKQFVDSGLKTLPSSVYVGEGAMMNSGEFDGLQSSEARDKILKVLSKKGVGREKVNYKMRDWLISRQRYWGCPIPIAYDADGQTHLIPDDQLPVELPRIDDYKPDDSGRSALAKDKNWLKVVIDGQEMTRETDTLDGYACSSWYLLRYADPHNAEQAWSKEMANYWNPVDCYVGADHAVAHLLYVRFWCKVFADLGLVDFREPVKKLIYHGYINDEKNKKMSKSKGNVINPLDIINSGYGADTLRTYEMFIAPYEMDAPWSTAGVGGVYRFLTRVWNLAQELIANDLHLEKPSDELLRWQHKTIKKVSEDIERTSFNTAVAALMEFLNYMAKNGASKSAVIDLAKLLMPFAPHIASELLEQLGVSPNADWPKWDEKYLVADEATIAVQVNGKLRGEITMPIDSNEDEVQVAALRIDNVKNFTNGKQLLKTIYVKNKIINFVTKNS